VSAFYEVAHPNGRTRCRLDTIWLKRDRLTKLWGIFLLTVGITPVVDATTRNMKFCKLESSNMDVRVRILLQIPVRTKIQYGVRGFNCFLEVAIHPFLLSASHSQVICFDAS